jgi:hypothetical protein
MMASWADQHIRPYTTTMMPMPTTMATMTLDVIGVAGVVYAPDAPWVSLLSPAGRRVTVGFVRSGEVYHGNKRCDWLFYR